METGLQRRDVGNAQAFGSTRARATYVPRIDVYETADAIVLTADVPGADEKSINVTLEENVLTLEASVLDDPPQGYALAYREYEVADYRRSFTLTAEIERDEIGAVLKNGVLRLTLPKAAHTKARKITVRAE